MKRRTFLKATGAAVVSLPALGLVLDQAVKAAPGIHVGEWTVGPPPAPQWHSLKVNWDRGVRVTHIEFFEVLPHRDGWYIEENVPTRIQDGPNSIEKRRFLHPRYEISEVITALRFWDGDKVLHYHGPEWLRKFGPKSYVQTSSNLGERWLNP